MSLLVWILPVVVVALGATGIVFALRRNRDQPHLHATEADERLVERRARCLSVRDLIVSIPSGGVSSRTSATS